jgi:feruloyl esterase
MNSKGRLFSIGMIVCMLLLTTAVYDVSAKGKDHGRATAAVPGVMVNPVIDYQDIQSVFGYSETVITSVVLEPVGRYPEHCIVKGYMNRRVSPVDGKTYAIGFEMRLPTEWYGRYYYQANGGIDGRVASAYGNLTGGGSALAKGFAVISSDAGHDGTDISDPLGGSTFGLDPQARLDYGYNAVAELTPMAKKLIQTYYGKFPGKSYFGGCSNGGRHAMVAASRYADEYDGFYAGAPGFNLPQAAVAQLWGVQQYATISDYDHVKGRPDISTSFSVEDQALVADAIIAKCDELDGAIDDMVSDPLGCQDVFNIQTDVPTCESFDDTGCLTYGQKSVLARIHAGAMDSKGYPLYTHFIWDPGERTGGWRSWKFSASITNRDPVAVGFIFTTPPQDPIVLTGLGTTLLDYALNWNGTGFDVDRDAPKIYAINETYTESAMSFMTPPDPLMKKLHAKGGKLIVVHGSADPVFSVQDTVNWYDSLTAHYKKHTKDFARLFIVPGMGHCGGGPACDQQGLFDALVDWVEKGIAPAQVESKVNPANRDLPSTWEKYRTRPLCAYPAVPVYTGSGDIEDDSNFTCIIQ